jgi:hypothetical protein
MHCPSFAVVAVMGQTAASARTVEQVAAAVGQIEVLWGVVWAY